MRTTLTLDDDVVAVLERLRKKRDVSLKQLINEALRRGLQEMSNRPKRQAQVQTRSVTLGRVLIAGIDNVSEALAIAEGEPCK
jgi:metal-responsive CopG/Arc/MetJ family transcriptional regulator